MKLQPIDHPVLGRLIPDKWGDTPMSFRQISGLRHFQVDHAQQQWESLNAEDRKLVESWSTVTDKLIHRSRDFEIFDSLRALGVYEVSFSKTSAGQPTDEQVAAWTDFVEHAAEVCANISQALLRYYQVARARDEGWFDNWDCPAVSTVAELGPLATLDGITVSQQHCEGMSLLGLSWKVNWDEEHGLPMTVWKDQVIGIGLEDVSDVLHPEMFEYAVWNSSHMTPTELAALQCVRASLLADRQGEDFAGEYADDDVD